MSGAQGAAPALTAVTFDYWNTLCYEPDIDQRRELVADAWGTVLRAGGFEVARESLVAAYEGARGEYWTAWHQNRQFTGTHAAQHVLAAIDGDGSLDHLAPVLLEAFHECSEIAEVVPVDGVGDAVASLRAAGIRVGIVCDVGLMASSYLRQHLERHGLLGLFDHWSFSDEVGVYKPDRRIFEHALDGLGGTAAGSAAHVGDRRRTDVAGALAIGMRAVRFTGIYDDDDESAGPPGDAVISSFADLAAALDR